MFLSRQHFFDSRKQQAHDFMTRSELNNPDTQLYGRSIMRLSDSCSKLLRSTVSIVSPSQVLYELLLNSLDSGASKIAVTFDMTTANLSVLDNGNGISPSDFKSLAQHNSTSRINSLEELLSSSFYGFRGESLACISAVSYLQIESKVLYEDEPMVKIIKEGKVLYSGFASECTVQGAHLHRDDGSNGESWTRVVVNSLFSNQPVRRRSLFSDSPRKFDSHQRGLTKSSSLLLQKDSSPGKRWGRLLLAVVRAIWVVLPQISITFLARGGAESDISFHSGQDDTEKGMFAYLFGVDKAKNVKTIQHRTIQPNNLFSKASFSVPATGINDTAVSSNLENFNYSFIGLISCPGKGTPTKQIQFVFINGRLCKATPIHTELNHTFSFTRSIDGPNSSNTKSTSLHPIGSRLSLTSLSTETQVESVSLPSSQRVLRSTTSQRFFPYFILRISVSPLFPSFDWDNDGFHVSLGKNQWDAIITGLRQCITSTFKFASQTPHSGTTQTQQEEINNEPPQKAENNESLTIPSDSNNSSLDTDAEDSSSSPAVVSDSSPPPTASQPEHSTDGSCNSSSSLAVDLLSSIDSYLIAFQNELDEQNRSESLSQHKLSKPDLITTSQTVDLPLPTSNRSPSSSLFYQRNTPLFVPHLTALHRTSTISPQSLSQPLPTVIHASLTSHSPFSFSISHSPLMAHSIPQRTSLFHSRSASPSHQPHQPLLSTRIHPLNTVTSTYKLPLPIRPTHTFESTRESIERSISSILEQESIRKKKEEKERIWNSLSFDDDDVEEMSVDRYWQQVDERLLASNVINKRNTPNHTSLLHSQTQVKPKRSISPTSKQSSSIPTEQPHSSSVDDLFVDHRLSLLPPIELSPKQIHRSSSQLEVSSSIPSEPDLHTSQTHTLSISLPSLPSLSNQFKDSFPNTSKLSISSLPYLRLIGQADNRFLLFLLNPDSKKSDASLSIHKPRHHTALLNSSSPSHSDLYTNNHLLAIPPDHTLYDSLTSALDSTSTTTTHSFFSSHNVRTHLSVAYPNDTNPIPQRLLVLADQHALSERVRVEYFYSLLQHALLTRSTSNRDACNPPIKPSSLFLGRTVSQPHPSSKSQPDKKPPLHSQRLIDDLTFTTYILPSPIPITVSQEDSLTLLEVLDELRVWFFELKPDRLREEENKESGGEEVWNVFAVPSILGVVVPPSTVLDIAHFLKTQPGNFLHATGHSPLAAPSSHSFVPPPPIARILASRACRGAVMFGDALTFDQALSLWNDAKKCMFPFQCAHGRNSMAIIGDLSLLQL